MHTSDVALWHTRLLLLALWHPGPERKWPCGTQGQNGSGLVAPWAAEVALWHSRPDRKWSCHTLGQAEAVLWRTRSNQAGLMALKARTRRSPKPEQGYGKVVM